MPLVPLKLWLVPNWARRWGTAMLAGLLVAGCQRSEPVAQTEAPPVVAEVGGRKILAEDLLNEATRRVHLRQSVPEREDLLREMMSREALLERARQVGLERDPAIRREIEALLIGRLLAAELEPRRESLRVTDEEVKAEIEARRSEFTRPAQARFAMLFLAAGSRASEAQRAEVRGRMEQARQRALNGGLDARTGFGSLALEFSDDQVTRYRGGDLGWIDQNKALNRIPTNILKAAWELPTGKISEVLSSPEGFYVVGKTDVREATAPAFETLQASLRQSLLIRKRKQAEDEFRAETARRVTSRVHTQVLATVHLPPAAVPVAARNREPQPPALPGTNESPHGN